MEAVVLTFMSVYFLQKNKRRMQGKEDGKLAGMQEQEVSELGDESPRFMFTY